MALIAVKNLSVHFKDKKAVKHVHFKLHKNKCIALIGPNGAGKTTILRTLAQLIMPTSGTINFQNMPIQTDIRKYIGYLPQYPVFFSWMTGLEFLIYSGRLASMNKKNAKEAALHLLEKVGISEAKNRKIHTYSGGMKQRLGIAQAMIHKPKLLLLDEPVSSLDPIGRNDVLQLMKELKQQMTIVFSTHILADADEVSDELLLLESGEMIESGSLDVLRKKYKTKQIELTFEGDIQLYKQKIDELPSVISSMINNITLHVAVKNMDEAREEILNVIRENKWPLTKFMTNHASLEQMFMKAVNR